MPSEHEAALNQLQSLREALASGELVGVASKATAVLDQMRKAFPDRPALDQAGFMMVRNCRRLEESLSAPKELVGATTTTDLRAKALAGLDAVAAAARDPSASAD